MLVAHEALLVEQRLRQMGVALVECAVAQGQVVAHVAVAVGIGRVAELSAAVVLVEDRHEGVIGHQRTRGFDIKGTQALGFELRGLALVADFVGERAVVAGRAQVKIQVAGRAGRLRPAG